MVGLSHPISSLARLRIVRAGQDASVSYPQEKRWFTRWQSCLNQWRLMPFMDTKHSGSMLTGKRLLGTPSAINGRSQLINRSSSSSKTVVIYHQTSGVDPAGSPVTIDGSATSWMFRSTPRHWECVNLSAPDMLRMNETSRSKVLASSLWAVGIHKPKMKMTKKTEQYG